MSLQRTHEALSILLISGTHERAHYAFVLAAGAAALGRRVQLFATNAGCHALMQDWSGLDGAGRDAVVRGRGVGGLAELRDACVELGVTLLVCEAGLRVESVDPDGLMAGVEVAGVARFLAEAAGGQIVSL
jgi:peroxiredoxin family protein